MFMLIFQKCRGGLESEGGGASFVSGLQSRGLASEKDGIVGWGGGEAFKYDKQK